MNLTLHTSPPPPWIQDIFWSSDNEKMKGSLSQQLHLVRTLSWQDKQVKLSRKRTFHLFMFSSDIEDDKRSFALKRYIIIYCSIIGPWVSCGTDIMSKFNTWYQKYNSGQWLDRVYSVLVYRTNQYCHKFVYSWTPQWLWCYKLHQMCTWYVFKSTWTDKMWKMPSRYAISIMIIIIITQAICTEVSKLNMLNLGTCSRCGATIGGFSVTSYII